MEILERRIEGSFVINHNGGPFHVIPVMYQELWEAVCAQEGVDPVAQAEKYTASLLPEVVDDPAVVRQTEEV